MARLFLASGETYGTVGGFVNTDVIGTNSNETVFVAADGDADFDPSFNRGGDVINIGGVAALYSASLVGSTLLLTADNGAHITIPVGSVGTTINFAGGDSRLLIFENGQVTLGDDVVDGTPDPLTPGVNPLFNLVAGTAAGADVAHITGSIAARIDITKDEDQVVGLDLNGDGLIDFDGVENVDPTALDDGQKFEIIDAYARDRTNFRNAEENFLGQLLFDGTGFNGDGVNTNGNIVLGGVGADTIFGGIGNDFLVGGGVLPALPSSTGDPLLDFLKNLFGDIDHPVDGLSGGRNADFFFADFSTLSFADGDSLFIDAGTTADDTSAITGEDSFSDDLVHSSQDSDWFLAEIQDDEEPIVVELREGAAGLIYSEDQVSQIFAQIYDMENFDATGNLYGFLDDVDVALGEAGLGVDWDGDGDIDENVGIGSTAQLVVEGSGATNIILGGSDNDRIYGFAGDDLLFGGNLKYHQNNPNTPDIINDGKDELYGGVGNDDIVFEADGGIIDGGIDFADDTLWLTDQSLGTKSVDQITTDSVLRFDLMADGLEAEEEELNFGPFLYQTAGYGGADVDGTSDQTNYGGDGVNPNDYRVDIEWMNSIDASGMGRVDYYAAGGNDPELLFNNHQNHFALGAIDLDLRGSTFDNSLFASDGDDVLEGRQGDDNLMGGGGIDDFYFSIDGDTIEDNETETTDFGGECEQPDDICSLSDLFFYGGEDGTSSEECTNYHGSGDGVDVIARKYDANGDNFWDLADDAFITKYGEGVFVQDVHEDGQDVVLGRGTRYWDIDGDGKYDLAAKDVAEDFDEDAFPPVLISQDFGLDSDITGNPSFLEIDFGATNFSDPNVLITNFSIEIGGEVFSVNSADLVAVDNAEQLATIVNARFNQQDASVTVTSVGNTLLITDAEGRDMSDQQQEGFIVSFALSNSFSEVFAQFSDQPPTIAQDRIIYKAYEDRSDNEGVDDDGITGSTISLGNDAYAEDLVVGFGKDGTRLAEDQFYTLQFGNLTTEDIVTVNVNGVEYSLQVGVALNGTQIDDEDGTQESQESVQSAFLGRLVAYINSFMDDDTAAGQICAEQIGDDTIRISQQSYDGEETVFINEPTVDIQNESGGEDAFAVIENVSEHEVLLFAFDGRDNNLNADNVLFWGQEEIQRSILETASDAGDTLTGLDALVIDNGVDDLDGIPNNKAVDDELPDNFAVHGDDFLIGGDGDDVIDGKSGDDRVQGSLGNDTLDGGNDLYAVRRVGDDPNEYAVEYLSAYEAFLADSDPTVLDIELIEQLESGEDTEEGTDLFPVSKSDYSAYFHDTLIYSQADIDEATASAPGTARFVIELNDYIGTGDDIIFDNGGAGTVTVDDEGDGNLANDTENVQTFQNFELIRTVSGIKDATAGEDGLGENQGNDTLDVSELSTDAEVGVAYDLTDAPCAGSVELIEDPDDDPLTENNTLRAVLRVDGVENVIFGLGDDLLRIDETEAAKNNLVVGDLGDDTVEYYNSFLEGNFYSGPDDPDFLADLQLEPNLTLIVEAENDTDEVVMTGGRLGNVVATDTLESIENIGLYESTGSSLGSNDLLDVTNVSDDVTINFSNGEVSVGGNFNTEGDILVTIDGITKFETFETDGGDDLVLIADGEDEMCCNVNFSDDSTELEFDTYLNYDEINDDCERLSIAELRSLDLDVPEVNNFGLYTFDLGDGDADRVDYSQSDDNIVAIVAVDQDTNYVFVDADPGFGDGNNFDGDECDRVDALVDVEEVVASEDVSILDFTTLGEDTTITFQFDPTNTVASEDRLESFVRIGDGSNNEIDGIPTYVEYYDLDNNAAVDPFGPATWNRIEGSDASETVIYEGTDDVIANPGLDHRFSEDELNLRGGDNEVHYNALNTSIITTIGITAFDDKNPLTTGLITAVNTFTDGAGNLLVGGEHTVTSYASDNVCFPASGEGSTLRIQASQDQEDTVSFTTGVSLEFALTAELITVSTPTAEDTLVLTGYEILADNGTTDDCYDFTDYSAVLAGGLTLQDSGIDDHDTVIIHNDYIADVGASIDLDTINTDFAFDFDVLDISTVTAAALLNVDGTGGGTDELVIGQLNHVGNVLNVTTFESLVVSQATVTQVGTSFVLDTTNDRVTAGGKTVQLDGSWNNILSFNGSLGNTINNPLADSCVDSATSGVTVTTAGNESVAIYGGDGNDTLTGGGAADRLYGGLGADTLNGSVIPAVGEVQTVTLTGNLDGNDFFVLTGPGGTIQIGPSGSAAEYTLANAIIDEDQLGGRLDQFTNAQLETELGYAAGSIANAAYDAVNNEFVITFTAAAGPQTDLTTSVDDGGDGIELATTLASAAAETTPAAAAVNAVDTFVYGAAADSTAASLDTIIGFDIDNGGVNDIIDLSAIDANPLAGGDQAFAGIVLNDTAQTSLTAFLTSLSTPGAMGGGDIYAGRTATDAYVVIDTDQSGAYNAGDTVIMLDGVTSLAAGTLDATNFTF